MRCVSPAADNTAIRTRAVRRRVTGRSTRGVLGDPAADRSANEGGGREYYTFYLNNPSELQSHSLIITAAALASVFPITTCTTQQIANK